ncbi:SMI1/KNR4 family protein [Rhizobacter sp. J219]|uniref:SMI1/KNR4 family protein n=1 Tax=Rhizobacter sp. J219 TaxID=2898430 RepID=UPI00215139AD|nr:SMI1/KNR4 family protein [Rhizobacter sp. J219]MCR5886111.1 SMI1/KNR4 family protein [Rhizobacter sp. J219]
MQTLTNRILSAKRKRLFGSKPMFEPYAAVSEQDIANVEQEVKCTLPSDLKTWLLQAGYGDFNEEFSLRKEWFKTIDRGQLKGHVFFAQDDLGNFYSFSPENGSIHYVSRSSPKFSLVAPDFGAFLEEFERQNFRLQAWVESAKALPYNWSA